MTSQSRVLQGATNEAAAERHPDLLAAKGDAMVSQGNLAGAINAFTAALQPEPSHLAALVGRAQCYARLPDWRCALLLSA